MYLWKKHSIYDSCQLSSKDMNRNRFLYEKCRSLHKYIYIYITKPLSQMQSLKLLKFYLEKNAAYISFEGKKQKAKSRKQNIVIKISRKFKFTQVIVI